MIHDKTKQCSKTQGTFHCHSFLYHAIHMGEQHVTCLYANLYFFFFFKFQNAIIYLSGTILSLPDNNLSSILSSET